MALYYDLPAYKDVYRLILKIFEHAKNFSREYKRALGRTSSATVSSCRARRSIWRPFWMTSRSSSWRCAPVDLMVLPIKKQAEPAVLMDSIGRQVTGWGNAGR